MAASGDSGRPPPPPGAGSRPTQVRTPPTQRPPRAEIAQTHPGSAEQGAADDLLALAPGTLVGEYRIEGRLGEGGMATVYSAVHPLIGKTAAIKVMSPLLSADTAAVERFVQEARSVNQIGHPNIVDVFAFGTLPDGRSYFVMEWLQGETLHARMVRERLPLIECLEILFHVCDALEAAHEEGIVHRDLKPENIFLVALRNNRKLVKLLDFGIAKLTGGGDSRVQRTRADMVMGTPQYLSPEQARAKQVDHRTDIYSLGAMAFEMIVGRVPFTADNVMDVLVQHMTEAPPAPRSLWPEIPAVLDRLLLQMLEKDPEARPTLDEIRQALATVRDSLLPGSGHSGVMATLGGIPSGPIAIGPSGPLSFDMPGSGPVRITPTGTAAAAPATALYGTPRSSEEAAALDAADESLSLAPKRRPLGLALGGGALLLALIGGFVVFRGGEAAAPKAPPTPVPAAPVKAEPAPPPEPPPEPVKPTVLKVVTNAANARIELDGKLLSEGSATATAQLETPGSHVIEASAPGRKNAQKVVTVEEGQTLQVKLVLRRAPVPRVKVKKDPGYMLDPFGNSRAR